MKRFVLIFSLLSLIACSGPDQQSSRSTRVSKGNPAAAVSVVEYFDLECPACRTAHLQLNSELLKRYGGVIRLEAKHFPLRSIHQFALAAAEAAECAADQGKFWEFVDLAYEEQANLSEDSLTTWAKTLQLDTAAFDTCRTSGDKRPIILADYRSGIDAGVTGTPTYFVNNEKVESTLDALKAAIEQYLSPLDKIPL